MSKGVKTVIGSAAAVAIPFAAPYIATAIAGSSALFGTGLGTFLGGAGGSALIGAGLGGAAGYATTGTAKGALMGAGLGGLGGFVGGGGMSGLFGGGTAAGAAAPAAGAAPASTAGLATPASLAAGTTVTPAGGVTSALGAAAGGGFNIPLDKVAQLAFTMFGRPPSGLSESEKAQLAQLERIRGMSETEYNRALESYMQMKTNSIPNPERAFAEAEQRIQRTIGAQTREAAARGVSTEQRAALGRAGAIEAARLGTLASVKEQERAQGAQVAAAQMQPKAQTYGLATPEAAAAALERRNVQDERNWYGQMAQAAGGLFGASKPSTGAARPAAQPAGLGLSGYTPVASAGTDQYDYFGTTSFT